MKQQYKKKLIEVAMPLDVINKAAMKEKTIRHGHPSTFHLWWARRPLATCRAILFAQLVDDPSAHPDKFISEKDQLKERERLFQIMSNLVLWKNTANEDVLKEAKKEIKKSCNNEIPRIYDPFSGGGTIPLEAKRLGCFSYGSDLNPVATLIGKAMIEFPSKYNGSIPTHPGQKEKLHYLKYDGLKEDILWYGRELSKVCKDKLSKYYPKIIKDNKKMSIMCWMWARTIESPDPAFKGKHVPLISTFWLNKTEKNKAWINIEVQNGEYKFEVKFGNPPKDYDVVNGTKFGRGANFKCILSNSVITSDYVKNEGMKGKMKWKLLAIIAEGENGRVYLNPNDDQEQIAFNIPSSWKPEEPLSKHPQYMSVTNFGPSIIGDLFMPRQLFVLNTFLNELPAILNKITDQKYKEIIKVYLVLSISRLVNRQSTSTFWDTGRQAVQGVFAMQALPMRWETAEGNPFSKSSGNFEGCVDYLCKNFDNFPISDVEAKIELKDARDVEYQDYVISTDPPYYDNVPYADLSDFFYVWIKRGLKIVFPNYFQVY